MLPAMIIMDSSETGSYLPIFIRVALVIVSLYSDRTVAKTIGKVIRTVTGTSFISNYQVFLRNKL